MDDIRSGRKVILPPSFIGTPRYLHLHFQNAIAIAREYHKPELFTTFTCNPQWPEVRHTLRPNQQPSERSDGKFHLLSKLYDKIVTLAMPLLFLNMIDIETSHLLHQHHLLFLLLILRTIDSLIPKTVDSLIHFSP